MESTLKIALLCTLSVISFAHAACSTAVQKQITNVGVEANAIGESKDEFYEGVYNGLSEVIAKAATELGLKPLEQSPSSDGLELRLWTGMESLAEPKLLVVSVESYKSEASYFKLRRPLYRLDDSSLLPTPRSGWDAVKTTITQRLSTPANIIQDPNFHLQRDEPIIVLEVRDEQGYRLVLFGQKTRSADGKRLLDLCDYLSEEFEIDMSCRSDRVLA